MVDGYRASVAALVAMAFVSASAETVPPGSRSPALRAEFQRLNPCPATGQPRGPCPGFQIDHKIALVCDGVDEISNLQWLSIEEHKAKTRVEVKLCRDNSRRPK